MFNLLPMDLTYQIVVGEASRVTSLHLILENQWFCNLPGEFLNIRVLYVSYF